MNSSNPKHFDGSPNRLSKLWPLNSECDKMVKVGPYTIKCHYRREEMTVNDLTVGSAVTLNCPENVRLHNQQGVVERLEDWGAHLLVAVSGTGRYRALYEEMSPSAPKGELTVSVEYTGNCCDTCGSLRMKRTGSCITCQDCGTNSGCA